MVITSLYDFLAGVALGYALGVAVRQALPERRGGVTERRSDAASYEGSGEGSHGVTTLRDTAGNTLYAKDGVLISHREAEDLMKGHYVEMNRA